MARLTIGQKGERVLKLLYGLRNAKIATILAGYGFTEEVRTHGWSLLAGLTEGRLSQLPAKPPNPKALERLDSWENLWFPIARASTRHRFPAMHEWLFRNLVQTDGLSVVVSVQTFVDRIDTMAQQSDIASASEARALLGARGLNEENLQEARGLLAELHSVEDPLPPGSDLLAEQLEAEDEMWTWYLEWGAIARSTIKDRRLLRELGFLQTRRTVSVTEESVENPVADDEIVDANIGGDSVAAEL